MARYKLQKHQTKSQFYAIVPSFAAIPISKKEQKYAATTKKYTGLLSARPEDHEICANTIRALKINTALNTAYVLGSLSKKVRK
jgi:hypothetical protein